MINRKVLVTGAGGFLGKHVLSLLKQEEVPTIAISRNHIRDISEREQQSLDLSDANSLSPLIELMNQCDSTIFLAARIPNKRIDSDVYNLTASIDNLCCEAFARSKCSNAIYVSGMTVLDFENEELSEISDRNPKTEYTRAKAEGELLFMQTQKRTGKNIKIVRINAPYGPGMPNNAVIPLWLRSALSGQPIYVYGKGQRMQVFTWVEDCAKALLVASDFGPGTYHFCGPDRIKMVDLAKLCCEITGSDSKIIIKSEISEDVSCPPINIDLFEKILPRAQRLPVKEGGAIFAQYLKNFDSDKICSL